jgi:hypothetical protein
MCNATLREHAWQHPTTPSPAQPISVHRACQALSVWFDAHSALLSAKKVLTVATVLTVCLQCVCGGQLAAAAAVPPTQAARGVGDTQQPPLAIVLTPR